jgi:hypothetical protein
MTEKHNCGVTLPAAVKMVEGPPRDFGQRLDRHGEHLDKPECICPSMQQPHWGCPMHSRGVAPCRHPDCDCYSPQGPGECRKAARGVAPSQEPSKAPDRLWLQMDQESPDVDDCTWCRDKINDTDVLYVRADLAGVRVPDGGQR